MRSINRAASKRYLRYLEAENRWNMRRERWVASRMRTWPSKMRYAASEQSKVAAQHEISCTLPHHHPPLPINRSHGMAAYRLFSLYSRTSTLQCRSRASAALSELCQGATAASIGRRRRTASPKRVVSANAISIGGVALSASHMDRNAYVSDGGEDE